MASASSIPASRVQDFSRSPFTYVPLNESGDLVNERGNLLEGQRHITVHYSRLRNATNFFDEMILTIREVFHRLCPCPIDNVEETEEAWIPDTLATEAYIADLRSRNARNFRVLNIEEQTIFPPLPEYEPALLARVEQVLERHRMRCPREHLSRLLTARAQVLKVHTQWPSAVLCISSKSPYFREINDRIRTNNNAKKEIERRNERIHEAFQSTASVRVFPDGTATLTLTGLDKLLGGNKSVTCDILISPARIDLYRRNKQREDKRTPELKRFYETRFPLLAGLRNPRILTPEIIFSTPKGIQFLNQSFQGMLFPI